MKIRKLRTKLLISFFVVIAVFGSAIAILGYYVIKKDIIERAQEKVKSDLNSAREVYREETDNLKDVVRFTALRFFIKDALSESDTESIQKELENVRTSESLDILTLTDAQGQVIIRAQNPSVYGDNQAHNELVNNVLSEKQAFAGTVIVPKEELDKEGAWLAKQAHITIIPTPKAKSSPETEESSGMCVKAAAPVFGYEGELIGVLYGGNLLNRNYEIVDKVKEIVYQEVKYKGKDIGTATIFQGDLRISTNVTGEDGSRAIGTRVSEEVYSQVLEKGQPWTARAFVVNDWYKTAYEPIRNINGEIIGILYVGTLEKPFIDMARNIFLVFLFIVLIATLLAGFLALILSAAVSRPLTHMLKATERLSAGDFGYKVDVKTGTAELNTLASSFNEMSSQLEDREQSLRISNERLASLNKTYLDLVGFVSHELKGILISTIANAYSVRDGFFGAINSKQRKALDAVTRNLDYLAETVRKFLNLSRIEKGELSFNKTEVYLKENIFDTALETFSGQIVEKQMEIINNIEPQIKVKCDGDLLLIAANNLVGNAVNYGFDKGKVVLNSRDIGDKVQIEIYNDSEPIGEEEKAIIFNKFSRLNTAYDKKIKGTGLGLFITKEIIGKHGGEIRVESKENGNSFIFQIEKGY